MLAASASSMSSRKPAQRIFRICFMNQGQVYEVFAKNVSHGSTLGFVEVGQLLFGERSQVVVDPTEERLKTEFADVKRFFVPLHAVIRIDEVQKEGQARIMKPEREGGASIPFPVPIYTPGRDPGKK